MKLTELNTRWLGRHFYEFDSLTSTNDYCKEQIETLAHGAAVCAVEQTSGRGTKGRAWSDLPGQAIAVSFVLKEVAPAALTTLPLLCGLAEVLALESLGVQAQIKWPNDIVLGDKKLSGILCESVIAGKQISVVCGVGINVLQTAQQFADRGLPNAGSIFSQTGRRLALHRVTAALFNSFEQLYEEMEACGFPPLRERYESRCATLNRQVRVVWQGREEVGNARGVADDGRLLCEIGGSLRLINHGEASVRGLWGYH